MPMNYYVLCIGGKPTRVFTDLITALSALTDGFKLTDREKRQIQKTMEFGLPVGEKVLVVGYEKDSGWTKDRSITRTE